MIISEHVRNTKISGCIIYNKYRKFELLLEAREKVNRLATMMTSMGSFFTTEIITECVIPQSELVRST